MTTEAIVLPKDDHRSQLALKTGWLGNERLIARAVLDQQSSPHREEIVFERIARKISRPSGIRPWLATFRAFSLTATLTPGVAVGLLFFSQNTAFSFWVGVLALFGVGAFQVAINVYNDIEDYRRLIDLPETAGGSGVIQNGWWTPLELRKIARYALVIGVLFGVPAFFLHPKSIAIVGFFGASGVLFYSSKRFGLKYHALGDAAVLLLCGPLLTIGFSLALGGVWTPGVLWIGGFFGCLAASLLHVNNLQDMNLDRKREVRTLALALGFKPSLQLLVLLQVFASLLIIVGVVRHELPGFALCGIGAQLFMSVPWLTKILPASGPESALLSICRIEAAKIHLFGGIGLCFGLLLSRYWSL